MNNFVIIDTEGTFLKYKNRQTLIVTEVSYAIFIDKNLSSYETFRLNYDLSMFENENYFYNFYKYVNNKFYNTFRNKMYVNNEYDSNDIRKYLLNKFKKYDIYAKGIRQECIWLFYPNCCDLNFVNTMPKINEFENKIKELPYVPKYDIIPNNIKRKAIKYYLNIDLVDDNILKHHISLYEILVFIYYLFIYDNKNI